MVAITISTLPSMHSLTKVTNSLMPQGLELHKTNTLPLLLKVWNCNLQAYERVHM